MGLSIAISGTIVVFSLFLVLNSFMSVSEGIFNQSITTTQKISIDRNYLDTDITISSLQTGTSNVTLSLENTGNTKLWSFEKFDFIVTYDTPAGRTNEELDYVLCPAIDGQWCIESITNDIQDPNILNTLEIGVLKGNLTDIVMTPGSLTVSITTDNGVTVANSVVT